MAFTTSSGRTQTSLAEINVTPFVDVVLVLLIIFMVTAPVIESGIEVDVPQTKTVASIDEERVIVSIKKDQTLYVGSERVNIHDLGGHLRSLMRDPSRQEVYVRCDKSVPFGLYAIVIDEMRTNGISKINVVTKPYQAGQE
jgi:biopolymer transport protein TolR